MLGVLPEFAVTDRKNAPPLTVGAKFHLFYKTALDPSEFAITGIQAGISQADNSLPAYGQGATGYGKRYGAAFADQGSSGFFANFFYPVLFKQDPRYFRPGTGTFWSRFRTAVSQIVVSRKDSGKRTFNAPEFLGNAIAVGISNSYSPNLRTWGNSTEKLGLMIGTDMIANVVKEFGPDLKERFFPRHHNGI